MNLEKTKVYTTDPEVIRKYAELCGKPFNLNHEHHAGVVGYDCYCSEISCFSRGGAIDEGGVVAGDKITEITPDQINALHAEKFGIMAQDNEQLQNYEMDERVECSEMPDGEDCIYTELRHIGDRIHNISCGMHDNEDLQTMLGDVASKLWSVEAPQQREERERLEAAYDLCATVYPDFSGFEEFKKATTTVNLWLAIVDKTGYRKQKDGE